MPDRITLSRAKGWKMPPNTVKVDRSTLFGNPFTVREAIDLRIITADAAPTFVFHCFRKWLDGNRQDWMGPESEAAAQAILSRLPALRGKNLACWCKPCTPCHADVLLELANA